MTEQTKQVPAVPPRDYRGTIADWMTELQIRGVWNGEGNYTEIMISAEEWKDILKTCEPKE